MHACAAIKSVSQVPSHSSQCKVPTQSKKLSKALAQFAFVYSSRYSSQLEVHSEWSWLWHSSKYSQ